MFLPQHLGLKDFVMNFDTRIGSGVPMKSRFLAAPFQDVFYFLGWVVGTI